MTRLLLIDDDLELCDMLSEYLRAEGFEVDTAHDGKQGVERVRSNGYDVVVLDVMLPHLDGFGVLRRIRNGSDVPVIMLTAKGEDVDRIVGLEIGADDYLAKPCNPRELAARLRAVLRRTQGNFAASGPGEADIVRVGALEMNPAARTASWARTPFTLTSTEFNLLLLLARSAGHVVSKEDLCQTGLGRPLTQYDRSIDMHISHLRRKLSSAGAPSTVIQTIRSMGYQFTLE